VRPLKADGRIDAHSSGAHSSLDALLEARVRATPDEILVVDDKGRRLTCAEFLKESDRLTALLGALGISRGTTVSWILPTGIDTLLVMVALSRLEAVQNPIVPLYREREIGHILREASPEVVLVGPPQRGTDYATMVRDLVAPGSTPTLVVDLHALMRTGHTPERLSRRAEPASDQDIARWIFYTSGSTGLPKGVRHTDGALSAVAGGMASRLMMTSRDRSGIAFPIAHVGGPINLMASFVSGAAMLLIERFDPVASSAALAREGVTMAGSGTAFHVAYLDVQRSRPNRPLFPQLRCCPGGGAPKPPGLHEQVRDELGGRGIISGWGLTEAPVLTMGSPRDSDAELSVTEGRALPGVELRVVTPNGEVLPTGVAGELRARAPQMMLGYVDGSLDAAAFDEFGYFRTGDLGIIDGDGHVRITGRLKDVIVRNGENVGAAEVEDLLRTNASILDVAVIGLPDANTGERVCAVIELAHGERALDVGVVGEFLGQQGLRRQAWPEQVEIIGALPRTVAGKIDKAQLRTQFAR
jgi:acyl-CoA synthetase (AMP-forming)/AMP-acid ligase II